MELTNATVDKITVTNENIQMRLQLHFTFVLDTDDKLCETSILGFLQTMRLLKTTNFIFKAAINLNQVLKYLRIFKKVP